MENKSHQFRMPAEWERHAGTWIFWPTRAEQYLYGSASDFSEVRGAFCRLIDILSAFEPIHVGAAPAVRAEAESILGRRATIHEMPLDDAWARDAAPTFVTDAGSLAAVCWRFTGWGGRFGPIENDGDAGVRIAEGMKVSVIRPELGMEGGGIHSNGNGTILTTAPVLYDSGRNPNLSQSEARGRLAEVLGANRVVVLPGIFNGDDTGGHVDVIAAFSPSGAVLLNDCEDRSDPNHVSSRENRAALISEKLEVVSVPQPAARFSGQERLAFSYLNFYVCNGAVIAPIFDDRKDDYCCGLPAERFPDHEVIPLDARPFYLGGGGIHCVTQQIPVIGE